MRGHLKTHDMSVKQYKEKYGQSRYHLLEPVYYHECGLCYEDLILDADTIHSHCQSKHGIKRMREYTRRFLVTRNVRKAGSSAEKKVAEVAEKKVAQKKVAEKKGAGRSVKKSLLSINVGRTLQSGKRKSPNEIGATPKKVRIKKRRRDHEEPQVCLNCGQESHMQGEGECTEPEKTRQYTDEEGNVKELYVPKEDIVDEELNKPGINCAKYKNIPLSVTGENIVESISQFQEAGVRP